MANKVEFELVKEILLKKDMTENAPASICLYARCGEMSALVGYVDSADEARDLLAPENIYDLLSEHFSELELNHFWGVITCYKKYFFYDEEINCSHIIW